MANIWKHSVWFTVINTLWLIIIDNRGFPYAVPLSERFSFPKKNGIDKWHLIGNKCAQFIYKFCTFLQYRKVYSVFSNVSRVFEMNNIASVFNDTEKQVRRRTCHLKIASKTWLIWGNTLVMTFDKEFPKMVAFIANNKMDDGHFRPYYTQNTMSPCQLQYDVILKQENFGNEFGFLAGTILYWSHIFLIQLL